LVVKGNRMTGYVPNPAAPPPARPRAALPVLDLAVAGLGLVAFVLAFLPWVGLNCSGVPAEGRDACEKFHYTGWELPAGTAGTVLLLVAGLLLVSRLLDPTAPAASPVPALLALLGAVLVIIQLAVGSGFLNLITITDVAKVSRKVSLFLVLVVALAEAAVAVLAWLQAGGRLTGHRAAVTPVGPGQPWQLSQPAPGAEPGWGQPASPPPGRPDFGQPASPPPGRPDFGQPADYPPQQPGGYGQPSSQGPPAGGYPAPPPGQPGPGDAYPPESGRHGSPRYP
jgi:hypothetical protein